MKVNKSIVILPPPGITLQTGDELCITVRCIVDTESEALVVKNLEYKFNIKNKLGDK